jgi:hypothetical protein
VTLAEIPSYEEIKAAILPLLGDGAESLEHMSVLFDDDRADMFVDDVGVMKRPPRTMWSPPFYRAWALHC